MWSKGLWKRSFIWMCEQGDMVSLAGAFVKVWRLQNFFSVLEWGCQGSVLVTLDGRLTGGLRLWGVYGLLPVIQAKRLSNWFWNWSPERRVAAGARGTVEKMPLEIFLKDGILPRITFWCGNWSTPIEVLTEREAYGVDLSMCKLSLYHRFDPWLPV